MAKLYFWYTMLRLCSYFSKIWQISQASQTSFGNTSIKLVLLPCQMNYFWGEFFEVWRAQSWRDNILLSVFCSCYLVILFRVVNGYSYSELSHDIMISTFPPTDGRELSQCSGTLEFEHKRLLRMSGKLNYHTSVNSLFDLSNKTRTSNITKIIFHWKFIWFFSCKYTGVDGVYERIKPRGVKCSIAIKTQSSLVSV